MKHRIIHRSRRRGNAALPRGPVGNPVPLPGPGRKGTGPATLGAEDRKRLDSGNGNGTMTRKSTAEPTAHLNQTLARGLSILDAFTREKSEWGVRELGRAYGINPTTVYRLTTTLCDLGYLERSRSTQRLRLGPKIVQLASTYRAQNDLATIARTVFEKFSHRFQHAFFLGVINDFQVAYIGVLESRAPLRVSIEPGGTFTLYSTAMGKMLLASSDDEFISRYLKRFRLQALTPSTITDVRLLRRQLAEIREQGYAVNRGELHEDIGGLAVPVYDTTGEVIAGMGFGFPLHYVDTGRLSLPDLIELGREISTEITERYRGMAPPV